MVSAVTEVGVIRLIETPIRFPLEKLIGVNNDLSHSCIQWWRFVTSCEWWRHSAGAAPNLWHDPQPIRTSLLVLLTNWNGQPAAWRGDGRVGQSHDVCRRGCPLNRQACLPVATPQTLSCLYDTKGSDTHTNRDSADYQCWQFSSNLVTFQRRLVWLAVKLQARGQQYVTDN
jgi:hypothetical protein